MKEEIMQRKVFAGFSLCSYAQSGKWYCTTGPKFSRRECAQSKLEPETKDGEKLNVFWLSERKSRKEGEVMEAFKEGKEIVRRGKSLWVHTCTF